MITNPMFPNTDWHANTAYEEMNSLARRRDGAIAIGRIKEIDPYKRLANVKTFMGPPEVTDLDLTNCQLVFPDAHPDGSEMGTMYRRGAIGLVFFIGGSSFFFGGIKPWNETGGDAKALGKGTYLDTEIIRLSEGDRSLSTKKGNHVDILANGQINLVAVENLLLRNYFPLGNVIRDVCSQYKRNWSGGFKHQTIVNSLTNFMMDYEENRRDLYRTFLMTTEKGAIGIDGIYRMQMGVGLPAVPGVGIPIYEETLSTTGQKRFTIAPAGLPTVDVYYGPEGSLSMTIGALQNFILEVGPTGATNLSINSLMNVALSEFGDIEVAGPVGSVAMDAQGNVNVANAVGSLGLSAQGDFEVANATGTILMDAQGNFELSGPTHVMSMNNGDILIEEPTGGALSISKGKVALTAAAGEVLEQFIATLTELDALLTALQAEQHVGNLGFPTAPPVNVADYIKTQVNLKKIATTLDLMKG